MTEYDRDNIFAKILRDEIPSDRVYEDDEFIAFRDIAPAAPVHVVLIPRGEAPIGPQALTTEHEAMLGRMTLTATRIAQSLDLEDAGYRLVLNDGADAGQTVFHLHMHILGGGDLGHVAGAN
jgi:histidine triad (HIT) family protein